MNSGNYVFIEIFEENIRLVKDMCYYISVYYDSSNGGCNFC